MQLCFGRGQLFEAPCSAKSSERPRHLWSFDRLRALSAGESGSVVAFLCDGGERYADTYYDQAGLSAQGFELQPLITAITARAERGTGLPARPWAGC